MGFPDVKEYNRPGDLHSRASYLQGRKPSAPSSHANALKNSFRFGLI